MKKYIVKVNYSNKHIDFITLKAKNNLDLEVKIAKELKDIFGDLKEIESIEYEKVERFTFDKKDYHWFVGDTYVGGRCLEKILDMNIHEIINHKIVKKVMVEMTEEEYNEFLKIRRGGKDDN